MRTEASWGDAVWGLGWPPLAFAAQESVVSQAMWGQPVTTVWKRQGPGPLVPSAASSFTAGGCTKLLASRGQTCLAS